MPNQKVLQRLAGLQNILIAAHQASAGLSSTAKGQERASFIDEFLSKVLPPIYRFGSGDDPISPSLPIVGAGQTRLYLAEAVAAVVEVKANLAAQWKDAGHGKRSSATPARVWRNGDAWRSGACGSNPLFAVGYTGWSTQLGLAQNLMTCPAIHGPLVIDAGLYLSKSGLSVEGPFALWGLIVDLHRLTNTLAGASTRPEIYAM